MKRQNYKKPKGEEVRRPLRWAVGVPDDGAVLDTLAEEDDQAFIQAERYRKNLQQDDEPPDEPRRGKNSESANAYLSWLKRNGY